MENTISIKGQNYNYAPGIATYAVDGMEGAAGAAGNNIFYTDIIISQNLSKIVSKIKNNYYPYINSDTVIERQYQDGDIFFDSTGVIYKLTGYEKIKKTASVSSLLSDYFDIVGKITCESSGVLLDPNTGRAILDTSAYSGFDIVSKTAARTFIDQNVPMNIISDKIDGNGNIQFVQFSAISDSMLNTGTMRIYFDTATSTFHISSENPIMVDADVKVKNGVEKDFDGYSKLAVSSDSLTQFHELCDKIAYNFVQDTNGVNYIELSVNDASMDNDEKAELLSRLINYNDSIYIKVYDSSMNQHIVKMNNDVKTYNTSTSMSSLVKCQLMQSKAGSKPDVSIYDIHQPQQSFNIQYNVVSSVQQYDASVLIDFSSTTGTISAADSINLLSSFIGVYKEVQAPGGINPDIMPVMFTANSMDNNDQPDKKYISRTVIEIPADVTSHPLYLAVGYKITNNAVLTSMLSNDVVRQRLLRVMPSEKYAVYYRLTETHRTATEQMLEILCVTKDLTDSKHIDAYNPVISTELPVSVPDIERASLLHNTEIFISRIITY